MTKKVEEIVREAKKGKGKLDEVLERRKDLLASQLEESQVQRMIAEDERRAAEDRTKRKKIEAGVEEQAPTPITTLLGFLAQQGVKGEDAANFIKGLDEETIMKLNLLSASPQGQNALLPLMLFSRQPQVTLKDMSDISKGYVDTAVKLVETMRPPEPDKGGMAEPFTTLFSKTLDELKETRTAILQTQISSLEKKIEESRFSPRDYIKALREDAEAIGLGRKEGLKDETQVKIAEMQTHTQLELEKMRMERENQLLQMQGEQAKWNAIRETFSPMLAVGAQPIAEALRGVGRKVGTQIQTGKPPAGTPPTGRPVLSVPCPGCGVTLGFQPPFPEQVKCPECGLERSFTELVTPPGAGPPAEQPPRRTQLKAKYG